MNVFSSPVTGLTMVVVLSAMRRTHGEPSCFSRALNGRHRTATRALPPPPGRWDGDEKGDARREWALCRLI